MINYNMFYILFDVLFCVFIFTSILFIPTIIPFIVSILMICIALNVFIFFYILIKDTKYIQDNSDLLSLSDLIEDFNWYFIFKNILGLSTLIYISYISININLMIVLIIFAIINFMNSLSYKYKMRKIFR